jgi:formylglycine-generating enzyme required for sulfatase activity
MKSSIIRSVIAVLFISATAHAQCPGDVIPNGIVNGTDLAEVLASWGPCSSCHADIDGDGQVNGQDLAAVLGGWGACRPIITSISPREGSIDGGGVITISGSFLANATSVWFGSVPAQSFMQVSPTRISAVAPAGTADDTVDIRVETSAGLGSLPNSFTFINEVIPAWATLIEAYPDPNVVFDPEHRAAIRASGYVWRVRDTATQIEMLLIPPGTFNMGNSVGGGYIDEYPVHPVTITSPFYIGRYEVTQGQWVAQMGYNPAAHQSFPDAEIRPVEQVSFATVQSFLSQTSMRLPTEAEWEYAYRAGTNTYFHGFTGQPQGSNDWGGLALIAWVEFNAGYQTNRVGQKLGNGFGLHDMSGNVWEWTNDWYGDEYYTVSPTLDPAGPVSGIRKVRRGGGWSNGHIPHSVSSRRIAADPLASDEHGGFRVARNP